jgi:putative SOS response-associated peptidase YedK
MCGRYTLTASAEAIKGAFQLATIPPEVQPRYNIAPTQPAPVVLGQAVRQMLMMQWGLVPSWAKDASGASKLINARAETIDEKPSFKASFARRRCLVVVDGFYEWGKDGTPYYLYFADRRVFALAGLWDVWKPKDGEPLQSFTIITTEPNDYIRPLHHRMAVILDPSDYAVWLDEGADVVTLKSLLKPYAPDDMRHHAVSPIVNSARVEGAELIEPYAPPQQKTLF